MSHLKSAVKKFSENMNTLRVIALGIPATIYTTFNKERSNDPHTDATNGAYKLLCLIALPVLLPLALVLAGFAACAALVQVLAFPFQALFAKGRDLLSSGSATSSSHGCGQARTCCELDAHEPDVAPGHFSPLFSVRQETSKRPQCQDENDASPSMGC